ncbi:MAG: hypothetical protein NVS1B10_02320 [Candidatus Saccharimonadales bacterium]
MNIMEPNTSPAPNSNGPTLSDVVPPKSLSQIHDQSTTDNVLPEQPTTNSHSKHQTDANHPEPSVHPAPNISHVSTSNSNAKVITITVIVVILLSALAVFAYLTKH